MKILKPFRGRHPGGGFREIIDMWRERKYCEVVDITDIKSTHSDETMWVESRPWVNEIGDVLLYDNPILDKIHSGVTWNKALFANEVMDCDNCSTWTFFPRSPRLIEKKQESGILKYNNREFDSCFIGTISVNTRSSSWSKYIKNFYLGPNDKPLMNHIDYLDFIGNHKFGLCLPGVGPKCLREMELMGLGTVPIFTPGVSTNYYNKLEEGKHFLFAETFSDIPRIVVECDKAKWEEMSFNCVEWYKENVSPKGCFELTTEIINKI
jgi:hypothetical protein